MNPVAFLVDKPEGMGSTDVVRHFKRNLPKPFKKIGHFGTLDPFATGLLIVGINGAQKLADYLHKDYPKTYRARGVLGISSDTGDKTGELVKSSLPEGIEDLDFSLQEKKWFEKFSKGYMQAPPAYSAAKHKGKNLYEYARKGIIIEKEKVPRDVLDFKLTKIDLPYIDFEVTVSSGTYIRVLFEDMAGDLGATGHLESLRRIKIGPHLVESASALDDCFEGKIDVCELYKVKDIVLSNEEQLKKYKNGIKLSSIDGMRHLGQQEAGWVKSPRGVLLGLARRVGEDLQVLFNFPKIS